MPVVTQFLTRAYFFAVRDGHAEALYRESVDWSRTPMDDGTAYRPPSGATPDGPFRPVAAAANDHALVVLGASTTTDRRRPAGFNRLPESVLWVTRDGKTFKRIAARDVVDAEAVRLTGIVVTSHGFVAVGNILPTGFADPGGIVVLRSDDGERWSVGERLTGEGTLYARALHADADRLLIDATDQVCDVHGVTYPYGLRIGPTVAWNSADAGETWSRVDLYGANSVLVPFGALIEGCPDNPKLGDLISLSEALDTEGSIVGFAGGALFARSRDGTTIGVSTDLATWRQAKLPGALPLVEDAREPYAQAIVLDITGAIRAEGKLALLALEDRPDAEGRPKSGGCQVRWWRSEDAGATWATGPLGRPFTTCAGATWAYDQLLDGSVVLLSNAIMANTNRGEASFRTGTPGALIPWATCEPGPNADCSFSTIPKPASEAPDWPGINLAGATITGAAIAGVQMPKANGYAALLSGTFGAADMHEAILSYAILEGDFQGANLRDAYLFNATIRADITGASLDGAELTGLMFGDRAVCPDGKAPTAGVKDAKAACRL